MPLLLRPGLALINRLTYLRKFTLIGVLLLIPILILMSSYLGQVNHVIQTAVDERAALPYYTPVVNLIRDIQRHRGMTGARIYGNVVFDDPIKANEQDLAADVSALDTIDGQLAGSLSIGGAWPPIRAQWLNLLSRYRTLDPITNFDQHTVVISQLNDLLLQVATRSGLILDPNLDSYYLVDLTTNVLPHVAEYTAQLRGFGTLLVVNQNPDDLSLFRIGSVLALNRVAVTSGSTAFAYVFKGNPALQAGLQPSIDQYSQATQAFLDGISKNFTGSIDAAALYLNSVSVSGYFNQATTAVDSIFALYNQSLITLNTVLQHNVDSATGQRSAVLALTGLVLIIALYLFFAFYRSVQHTIAQLDEVARQLTNVQSGGAMPSAQVTLDTRDELGQIGNTFNQLAGLLIRANRDLAARSRDLEIANAMAREASRVKSHFLSTMSHELRTPLNAIVGFTDLLLTGKPGPLTETQQNFLERTAGNNRRLLTLINDILDLSRIEAGRVDIEALPYSPHTMIDRMAAQSSSLFSGRGLTFKLAIEPTLPAQVVGDQARVEQVVMNLLSNAAKFTPVGQVTLTAGAIDADHWQVAVTDSGRGIPMHLQEVIFEPFRQVDSSSTREVGGSGLGLAISRELVVLMNGTLTVSSAVNKGSTFTLVLPIGEVSATLAGDNSDPAMAVQRSPNAAATPSTL